MATMTAEEFMAIPYSDETKHWQLVEGEIVKGSTTALHQELGARILIAVRSWITTGGHGTSLYELGTLLDERNVYKPDVLWFAEPLDLRADHSGEVPQIAAEVRSPSTWRYDIGAKKAAYEREGLRELWLVDTEAEGILVFRRSSDETAAFDVALELAARDTLTSPQLAGFALDVGELFAV